MEKPVNDNILKLIEQYRFDQLSEEQQGIVLSEMSEQEFLSFQIMMEETASLSGNQHLKAPEFISSNLHHVLADKFVMPQSAIARVFNFGIPLWLIGMLAIGLCLLWAYTDVLNDTNQNKDLPLVEYVQAEPVYIYKTDTIFQEIKSDPIIITKEIIKTVEVEVPVLVEQEPVYVAGSQKELGLVAKYSDFDLEVDETFSLDEIAVGQSVAEDELLMEFLDGGI